MEERRNASILLAMMRCDECDRAVDRAVLTVAPKEDRSGPNLTRSRVDSA